MFWNPVWESLPLSGKTQPFTFSVTAMGCVLVLRFILCLLFGSAWLIFPFSNFKSHARAAAIHFTPSRWAPGALGPFPSHSRWPPGLLSSSGMYFAANESLSHQRCMCPPRCLCRPYFLPTQYGGSWDIFTPLFLFAFLCPPQRRFGGALAFPPSTAPSS